MHEEGVFFFHDVDVKFNDGKMTWVASGVASKTKDGRQVQFSINLGDWKLKDVAHDLAIHLNFALMEEV